MKNLSWKIWGGVLVAGHLLFPATSAAHVLKGWTGDIFAGYSRSSGNTDKSTANLNAEAIKKFDHSQFLLKGNVFYSETSNKMDGQKWDALSKYTRDYGKDYRWFNYYQVLAEHDFFAGIDYRITPATGIGYHIATGEDFKWDADIGVGYRITQYKTNKNREETPTALLHTFLKKNVFIKAFIAEDLSVYPGLLPDSGVIIKSESIFSNPLSERLDLQLKYIVDYNSDPGPGKTTTDKLFIAGLKYHF